MVAVSYTHLESILHGRKDEAESILNQAISYIMGTQDMGACKARVLEILVLLSRASIAAGASEMCIRDRGYAGERSTV